MDAASPNSASLLPLDDLKAALLARAHVDTGRLVQSPDPDLLALRCMGQDSITDFDRALWVLRVVDHLVSPSADNQRVWGRCKIFCTDH